MAPDIRKLWCINWPNGQIQAIDPRNGSLDQSIIAGGFVHVNALLFDVQYNQAFFAADYNIYVVGDMGTCDPIHVTDDVITSLAIIGDILYYSAIADGPSGGYVASIDLKTFECTTLLSLLNKPSHLAADKAKKCLYYTDIRGGKSVVIRVDTDGHSEVVIGQFDNISEVCLHQGKIYVVCPDKIVAIDGDYQSDWYSGKGLRSLAFTDDAIFIASGFGGDHVITKLRIDLTPIETTKIGHDVGGGEPSCAASSIVSNVPEPIVQQARNLVFIDDQKNKIGIIDLQNGGPVKWQLRSDIMDNITSVAVGNPINIENHTTSYVYICNGESPTSPPANSIGFVFIGGESSYPIANLDLHNPTSLAVDEDEGYIFCATKNEIGLVRLVGGVLDRQNKIVDRGLGYTDITSCVWDPLEKRLWWCATRRGSRGIFATNASGKTEKTSEWRIDDSSAPSIISIDSISRTIYWVSSGGEIYLSPYNSRQGVLIKRPKLEPQHLVNDGHYLYWSAYDGITMLSMSDWSSKYLYSHQTSGIAVG